MAESNLMLHCGAAAVSEDDLANYRAPAPSGRWHPVSHSRVLAIAKETLADAGFEVVRQRLGLMRDGSRFFGTLDLASPLADGVTLAVGVRNSVDKSFPLGFCAGSRVFVCDNLSFSAELLVRRKHTLHGERDFAGRIAGAMAGLHSFREQEGLRIERLKGYVLDPERADACLLRAYERGILGARELPKALREWREPSHEEFRPATAWSLYNAITAAIAGTAASNPQRHAAATMRLHGLLDPERN